jgi:hypothetical protein
VDRDSEKFPGMVTSQKILELMVLETRGEH